MIHLIAGSDNKKIRARADAVAEEFAAKYPGAPIISVDEEALRRADLRSLAQAQGLFEPKTLVVLSGALSDADRKKEIAGDLKKLSASGNLFLFIEGKVDKTTLEKFQKAGSAEVLEGPQGAPPKFDIFSVTDAFGRRSRKDLWVLLEKARRKGVAPEEIHGILFWQTKSMLLASRSKSAEEAGLKPFVYGKAKGFLRNYKQEEFERIASELVAMYHEAHRGKYTLQSALERFALSI